ncbi:nitronate monooxygenase [Sphingobium sp.]|uniref:NAD(P)H-dependent flavin oxidoreductase n=1 Tax=Sphingobium sp. TaxID=1912891 RepID=UPI002C005A89|nr:nitronate monooxygenase [Sphingobium sp.]HUD92701.1 nitronate monooxygenase [Sphingobium sp.]
MPIPAALLPNLKVPVIAAPMLIASNPELVIETSRAGAIGTFPALNPRSTEEYAQWLDRIEAALGPEDAAFGVNLIVAKINTRLADDIAVTVSHRVPLVVTSFGADRDVVKAVHDYGGLVFHDAANARHVEIAAEAGVDGIILLTSGAGGHTGYLNPFAFLADARKRYDGALLLAGALSTGRDVAAAIVAGADMAYMGSRFLATPEASVAQDHRTMIVEAGASDVTATAAMSGTPASFLNASLRRHGLDPRQLGLRHAKIDTAPDGTPLRAWKEIWSAGQGVAGIDSVLPAAVLVQRLADDYRAALADAKSL